MTRSNPAAVGIEVRHKKRCGLNAGGGCTCQPSYRGTVYDASVRRNRHGPWLTTMAAARGWRIDALARLQRGGFEGATDLTLREVAEQWFAGAKAGTVRNRAATKFKPSVIRSYRSSLDLHVLPALGGMKLSSLRRRDIQALIDRLSATLGENTVRNAVSPLRAICRYAVHRDLLAANPCTNLEVPKTKGARFGASRRNQREAVASREEAAALISALPDVGDRAIWATAFYAGLRRGELRGLFRREIDMDARTINVNRSWDALDGQITTKTEFSTRTLPMAAVLRAVLLPYLAQHDGREFAFPGYGRWGREYGPFSADALLKRSRAAWEQAGLAPIGLHEARHTFASMMIDAGIPIAKVSRHMGHSSVAITERVYFQLLPDAHEDVRLAMDGYFGDS